MVAADSAAQGVIAPRSARRRTAVEISVPQDIEASPSKEQLKQENRCYKLTLESIEQETCAYAHLQRSEFEGAAQ